MSHEVRRADRDGRNPLRLRDLIIIGAAGIVSLAMSRGLYDQAGFDVLASLIGGLGLFVILTFLHVLLRRTQRLSGIEPRIEDLEHRISGMRPQPGAPQRRQPPGQPQSRPQGEHGPMRQRPASPASQGRPRPQAAPEKQHAPDNADHSAVEINPAPAAAAAPVEATQPGTPAADAPRKRVEAGVVDDLVRALAGELGRNRAQADDDAGTNLAETAAAADTAAESAHPLGEPESVAVTDALGQAVLRAAESGDVEIFLQPVMSLADRKPRLYEVFPRIRTSEQELAAPHDYAARAEELGVARDIERIVLQRVHTILGRLAERGRARALFCNISRHLLSTPPGMLDLFEIMKSNRGIGELLVLEMTQADFEAIESVELESMGTLMQLGFRFSLDGVQHMPLPVERLAASGFGFIKLTPSVLASSRQTGEEIASMLADLRQAGIEPVMEGIAHGGDIGRLPAIGLQLGQGDALAEPRPVRPDLLENRSDGSAVA